ncbi:hypothetical protein KO465_03735 [Candidatus Micrarchaeota archaeon]|nr:hypothetical protein [Candidatus Micrarchaeota archaeon]
MVSNLKSIFTQGIEIYPNLVSPERKKTGAAVFAKDNLFMISKTSGLNERGRGEIISITGYKFGFERTPSQFQKFEEAVRKSKLKTNKMPRMFVEIIEDSGTSYQVTTDETIIYDVFSENYWGDLWLPETVVDWNGKDYYNYKRKFKYWFTLTQKGDRITRVDAIVFVNNGFIIKDLTFTGKNGWSDFKYNVRGWTGHKKQDLRSEFSTLVRIDGAHGYYHIHFGKLSEGGTVVLPSFDEQNIEIRASISNPKYLQRKLKRLDEKNTGLVIVD